MGLHSKVRYAIILKGETRQKQKLEIIEFATGYYDYLFDFIAHDEFARLEITQKLARFVSLIFTFIGFEDDEIYHLLLKNSEKKRKRRERC